MSAFEFGEVSGGYASSVVVSGLSGAAQAGEALFVLGRNGVGKSTLLKLLHGYLPLVHGSVRYGGRDLAGLEPAQRTALGIAYAPQERVVFDDLTVRENLTLMHPGRRPDALQPYFERFPRLGERLDQLAGTLSGGERKVLSFVRALAEGRPVTLLDEPSEGVQKENVSHMADLIALRKQGGAAFVIVEQNLALMEAVADRILVIDHGRGVLAGERAKLQREAILAHLRV